RLGWISVLFAIMVISKVLQIGGIVGGTAIALSILWPIGGEALADPSRTIWHAIVILVTIIALRTSRYQLIEKGAIVLVVTFSAMTIAIAFGLPFTPWGYGAADLAAGFAFHLPPAAL